MFIQKVLQQSARRSNSLIKPSSVFTAGFNQFNNFHSSRVAKKDATAATKIDKLMKCYQNSSSTELYHHTNVALAALTPAALFLSPLPLLNWPVDMGLALIIPVHAYYGLVGVVQDYVPKAQQSLAIMATAVVAFLMGLGLLKINLCGAGVTESVKCLWRAPKKEAKN